MRVQRQIIRPTRNVGELSSKFGYDPTGAKFEAAIREKQEWYDKTYEDFKQFMIEHDCSKINCYRSMFLRFYEEFVDPELTKESIYYENKRSPKKGNRELQEEKR